DNYKVSASAGFPFAGGRGHVLVSGTLAQKDAIHDTTNRIWDARNDCVMNNPAYTATNGQPLRVTASNCTAVMTLGGLVMTGPLRGTAFGPGGTPYQYTFGSIAGNTQIGGSTFGDVKRTEGNSLDPAEKRRNVFFRGSYDLTENITASYTFNWANSDSDARAMNVYRIGSTGVTVRTDNPFIPASLLPALAGVTSFRVDTLNGDVPNLRGRTDRSVTRHAVQLDGRFGLWGDEWVWNAYYQHGEARNVLNANSQSQSRFLLATDAVRAPNGQIVCRSTLSDPTNGCVPFNIMGEGVNSQAAIDYIYAVGHLDQTNTQKVAAASVSGDLPFGLPAGRISVALDGAYRVESASGESNPGAMANDFWAGNYKPINGKYDVKEAAIETVIPLLRDVPLAQALEVNLAARAADYSTSGFVLTWKAGATYTPVTDLTFRGNLSRDIRAGNLGELFAAAPTLINNPGIQDPFTQTTANIRSGSTGNPDLDPEKADGRGVGVVYRPSFVPGFTVSVDYWRIAIKDEIRTISVGQALQLCFSGNEGACQFITRAGPATLPGAPGSPYAGQLFAPLSTVIPAYINIANSTYKGVDLSATYRFDLNDLMSSMAGTLTLNWNQSFYLKGTRDPGLPGSFVSYTDPTWRAVANASYRYGPWLAGVTARIAPDNAFTYETDPQIIECQSGCPLISTLPANIQTQNYVYREDSTFIDANFAYSFEMGNADMQAYLNIRNLLDRSPVHVPTAQPWTIHQAIGGDDALGRLIRVGLRVRM
ncbi:TonB-dependent receptor domain-containing protein, partial [Phenylobacterium sp.]|uniref:TonB-dependent receptor domain-containing protein n=1 Tax=Phenylobacterium sp. TaxID=1871053 RepID=UPI00378405C7